MSIIADALKTMINLQAKRKWKPPRLHQEI
jgi:hypothetical protein